MHRVATTDCLILYCNLLDAYYFIFVLFFTHTHTLYYAFLQKLAAVRALWTAPEKETPQQAFAVFEQCTLLIMSAAMMQPSNQLFHFSFLKCGKRYYLHRTPQLLQPVLKVSRIRGSKLWTLRWCTRSATVWPGTEHRRVGIKGRFQETKQPGGRRAASREGKGGLKWRHNIKLRCSLSSVIAALM